MKMAELISLTSCGGMGMKLPSGCYQLWRNGDGADLVGEYQHEDLLSRIRPATKVEVVP